MAEVSQHFGRNLAAEVLVARPTIEQLAELLRGKPLLRPRSSLIVLQASGQHPPLICLPGIFGTTWEFRRLAQCLGADFPVYALPPVGVDGVASPHATIVEMARHNVDQLRTVQPHGPYYLAGHSLGGTVAYEMAQILQCEGETVPLLVLMDAPIRGHSRCFRAVQRIINRLTQRYGSGRSQAQQRRDNDALSASAVAAISEDIGVEGAAPTAAGLRLLRTHRRALDRYRPRPYPGRVTIFRPQIVRKGFNLLFRTDGQGWIDVCQKGGEIHVVPGDHSGMFSSGCIKTLANTLKTCLLAAIERPGNAEAD
jgi:thioesterase domain-containing protein